MTESSLATRELPERPIGAVLFLAGAALAYWFLYTPYAAMLAGAASVEFGFKSAALGPLLMGMGTIQLVFGQRAAQLLGRSAPVSWRTWALVLPVLGVGVLAFLWLQAQAASLGYGSP
jgi:hypothetical protein